MRRSGRKERPSPGYVLLCIVVFILAVTIRACKHGVHRDIARLFQSRPGARRQPVEAVPIEGVKKGDIVLARDPRTGRRITARVAARTVRQVSQLRVLDLQPVDGGSPVLVRTTDDHRFWVPSKSTWVPAAQLAPGTLLGTGARATYRVRANRRERLDRPVAVYNLVVPGAHSYYLAVAGKPAILVHNLDCLPPPIDSKRPVGPRPSGQDMPPQHFASAPAAPWIQVPLSTAGRSAGEEDPEMPPRTSLRHAIQQALDLLGGLSGDRREQLPGTW